ncbi:hypothetical protein JRO89_XS12G0035100 [Xanthoceras sorbifolium]|uniref:Uncharacterized protein n=1 Tax=Xanthoceras sorbifolium TaxID=99658 RepID=A0ABQ8HAV4_9ROSI|nr:hypothetical protein JRO89_XS12G0035100 [Xanthoceras sorbifolium]
MAAVNKVMMIMVMLIAATFLNLAVATTYGDHDQSGSIHVSGEVWCQDCFKPYYKFVEGDKPIKGVKVSLTCMDERSRVMYYKSDLTDEKGYYEMEVERYVYGKELKANLCRVRLVSSPDPTCNVITNFAGGKSGVNLQRLTEVYGDTLKYKLGHFFFTTPMCEKPDTTTASDDHQSNGNNY